ncbi:hypothetical protein CENSYa_1464 [Cenarchaeum symbiosum A]|uniref:Uncharacterized protein n=1 Tax=Cenarchaeum symbiosum (strain A) TaxID=414004 RepID=A0RXL9_CENSY|nr:hypothetical protein CENSYa_1464 [Cenarchaeum symbiosum A]
MRSQHLHDLRYHTVTQGEHPRHQGTRGGHGPARGNPETAGRGEGEGLFLVGEVNTHVQLAQDCVDRLSICT